jgi:hypothetical protein
MHVMGAAGVGTVGSPWLSTLIRFADHLLGTVDEVQMVGGVGIR